MKAVERLRHNYVTKLISVKDRVIALCEDSQTGGRRFDRPYPLQESNHDIWSPQSLTLVAHPFRFLQAVSGYLPRLRTTRPVNDCNGDVSTAILLSIEKPHWLINAFMG